MVESCVVVVVNKNSWHIGNKLHFALNIGDLSAKCLILFVMILLVMLCMQKISIQFRKIYSKCNHHFRYSYCNGFKGVSLELEESHVILQLILFQISEAVLCFRLYCRKQAIFIQKIVHNNIIEYFNQYTVMDNHSCILLCPALCYQYYMLISIN